MDSTYHCKSSDLVTLTITPADGWYLHSIFINDKQVRWPNREERLVIFEFNHNYIDSDVDVNFRKLCPDTVKDVDGNIYLVEWVGCNC
ncbi:hypothetical protein LJC37_04235, partial [Bacteroidales bacterium OttesenSCG-928-E04]|nr:hypothetical protein [Bacteroidales bacterium OttesenSCG-928-E04]